MFFGHFRCEITEKALKLTKKVEKQLKKMFQPAFGCAQHPKAGQNTQHLALAKSEGKLILHDACSVFVRSVVH